MESVVTNTPRRQFLGSALALGAGAALGGTVSSPRAGLVLAAGQTGGSDLVGAELLRQLRQGVNGLRAGRTGESARSIASIARLMAAREQAAGADTAFARRVQ